MDFYVWQFDPMSLDGDWASQMKCNTSRQYKDDEQQ